MWINPMLSIWLYLTIGFLLVSGLALWKWYSSDEDENI